MKTQLFVVAQMLLGLVLVWCAFCRVVKTDCDTRREVRWSFVFQMAVGGLVAGAPLLPVLMPGQMHWRPLTTPPWIWMVLLVSFACVQVATAVHWADGKVPAALRKDAGYPRMDVFHGWFGVSAAVFVVAVLIAGPQMALAQPDAEPDGKWRDAGQVTFFPPGAEVKCFTEKGCYAFTAEALRALLDKASGTCGRIPLLPSEPKGRST